ncbi:UNVERIFIED_CONTAM: hypothetical protein GTU68_033538 [Idotea baltica]|nr:hypothetical protein [Idotea baltica]
MYGNRSSQLSRNQRDSGY